ncbi:MAG: mobile mystery protein A [Candidatus Rokubacteria bacterium]|nr:mobile mystery protein A [Candidatus Rokubacteria bacterium]MBI2553777.1 mobile mystery protein A [Candidatus Rokubacteria bacterium]
MPRALRELRLEQTDAALAEWRRVRAQSIPKGGWVRAIRESLGMTTSQLAARLGVTQQAIVEFEKNEARGKITLDSLNKLANALGCRLAYALVPSKPLAEIRRHRARTIAEQQLRRVSHSMKLEAQRVERREEKLQLERLVKELLQGSPKKLWD